MRRLIFTFLLLSAMLSAQGTEVIAARRRVVASAGPTNGYTKGAVFTFNVHPSGNLTAFPNLILGTYAELADVAHGGYVQHTVTLNGNTVPADLIFTSDSAGSTLLSWEIMSWNNATGAIIAYVNSNRLASSDTLIYAWVGKSTVTTYQCTASATWNGFTGIWHLGNGTTLSVVDSTGTSTATNHSAGATTGQVDGAASFVKASGQYIDTGYATTPSTFTVSGWLNTSNATYQGTENKGVDSDIDFNVGTDNLVAFCVWTANGSTVIKSDWSVADGAWHLVAGEYDGAHTYIYVDGVVQSWVGNLTGATANVAANWMIGRIWSNSLGFQGAMQEVRISSSARAAAWLAHEYLQQKGASAWYTVGSWN